MKATRSLVIPLLLVLGACERGALDPSGGGTPQSPSYLTGGAGRAPRFVYVANDGCCTGAGSVSGYVIQADGSLAPLAGSPFSSPGMSGCVSEAPHPNGQYLYVMCDISVDITAFSIGSDGTLTPFQRTPLSQPGPLVIHPAGSRSEERRVGKECRSRWSPYH